MKLIKNETVEKNVVKLTFEVDKEAFEKAMEKSYKKNVKHIALAGFRKGKAPRKLIEKIYGEAVFYEDAVNFVCPDAYEFAVKEAKIEPVEMPEIDIEEIGEGKDLVLTAKVTVKPEVKLGEYKSITAEKNVYKTEDADVDAEIKAAQEKNARMTDVERPVKAGDVTIIDFEGFVDGKPFEGGKGKDYTLEIGKGQFIPGFEDALIGAEIGKETEINVTFPEDYHAEELKGKPATFKVTVNQIQEKELPALDDEFAKDVSEFDTFEEYKNSIKDRMDKANETRTQSEFENNVIKAVVDNAEVDIPECMINERINELVKDFGYRLSSQGLNMEQYMQMTGSTPDSFKEAYKEPAKEQVKTNLVLEAVANAENIEITDDDVEAELKAMAELYKMELDKLKKLMGDNEKESIKADLKIRKAVKLIADAAKEGKPKATKKTAAKKDAEDKPKKTTAKKTTAKKAADDGEKPKRTRKTTKKTEDKAE